MNNWRRRGEKIYRWLTDRFSDRGQAMLLFRQGMAKAKAHDHQGAIDDYSAAIALPGLPPDVRAMALFNRALVHVAVKDDAKAIDDLKMVLAMKEASTQVRTESTRSLVRIGRRAKTHPA